MGLGVVSSQFVNRRGTGGNTRQPSRVNFFLEEWQYQIGGGRANGEGPYSRSEALVFLGLEIKGCTLAERFRGQLKGTSRAVPDLA